MATMKTQAIRIEAATAPSKAKTVILCDLRNCTIADSCMGHNCLEGSGLEKVKAAYKATGHILHYTEVTQIDGVVSLKYLFPETVEVDRNSTLTKSIVKKGTSVRRSKAKASTLENGSVVWRSVVTGSTVSHSQICRATLADCDVEECVISRSNFKGVTLKYGVWKDGRFVRGIDGREPVAIASDGTVLVSSLLTPPALNFANAFRILRTFTLSPRARSDLQVRRLEIDLTSRETEMGLVWWLFFFLFESSAIHSL